MRRLFLSLVLTAAAAAQPLRIVSVGTSITETVIALGAGPNLVGIDNPSKEYIHGLEKIPSVGSYRTISAEGILSLKPTIVLLSFDAGPPEALTQLRTAGANLAVAPRNFSVPEVIAAIRFLAEKLDRKPLGEDLVRGIQKDMETVAALQKKITSHPKVLFCGLGPNAPTGSISGTNTRIDEMIRLSGGINPIQSFEGSRPMTDEGVVAAAPDVILITERGFERAGGVEGTIKMPGIALTPAGRNRRIVPVSDMYLQGFGPGIAKAILELTKKLHPELQ